MNRIECLEKVKELICEDRQQQYGDSHTNFEVAAVIASIIIKKDIDTKDIPLILAAVKLSRESFFHKDDNILDLIGYLALYIEEV